MSSLPEDIRLEILLRVPVKSTFVCKCVCKKWYALISDPDFVKSHLDLTTQRNNCSLLVNSNNAYRLYSSCDSDAVELETPRKYLSSNWTLWLGSCNGLVYGWNLQFRFYFLWNPAARESKKLPIAHGNTCSPCPHGFGYDHKTEDYKLVRIEEDKENTLVRLYSLQSNLWKTIQTIRYEFLRPQTAGVSFNGALHWLVSIGKAVCIVSFNIGEEGFEEVQLPTTQRPMSIGVVEGRLCVLAKLKETLEVWVMQVYRVPESWTRLYTITYERIFCPSSYNVELIGSFKNGEILFSKGCMVIFYDPKYGTARKLEIANLQWGRVVKHFESLVSQKSIVAMGRRKRRELTESMTTKRNRSVPKLRGG